MELTDVEEKVIGSNREFESNDFDDDRLYALPTEAKDQEEDMVSEKENFNDVDESDDEVVHLNTDAIFNKFNNKPECAEVAPSAETPQATSDQKSDADESLPHVNLGGEEKLENDLCNIREEDKPWKKVGADISDYFNFGFDEKQWLAYCERKRKMKLETSRAQIPVLIQPQQQQQQQLVTFVQQVATIPSTFLPGVNIQPQQPILQLPQGVYPPNFAQMFNGQPIGIGNPMFSQPPPGYLPYIGGGFQQAPLQIPNSFLNPSGHNGFLLMKHDRSEEERFSSDRSISPMDRRPSRRSRSREKDYKRRDDRSDSGRPIYKSSRRDSTARASEKKQDSHRARSPIEEPRGRYGRRREESRREEDYRRSRYEDDRGRRPEGRDERRREEAPRSSRHRPRDHSPSDDHRSQRRNNSSKRRREESPHKKLCR